jgi:maleylacetate reductase
VRDGEPAGTGLNRLRADLGVVGVLRELGFAETDIPHSARLAHAAMPPSNPRPVTARQMEGIIRNAWAGPPISAAD